MLFTRNTKTSLSGIHLGILAAAMEAGVPEAEDKLRGELHRARLRGEHRCFMFLSASQALAQGSGDSNTKNQALLDIAKLALGMAGSAIQAISPEHLSADEAGTLRHLLNTTTRLATPLVNDVVAARVEEDAERVRLLNQAISAHVAWSSRMRGPEGFHSNWRALHDPAPLSPDSRDSSLPSGDQAAAKLRLERELHTATLSQARMREHDDRVSNNSFVY